MCISTIAIVIIDWIIKHFVPDFGKYVGQKTPLLSQGGGGWNLHYLEGIFLHFFYLSGPIAMK